MTSGGDALFALGELYRDERGHEVWRIRALDGSVHAEGVASDHDARWIAEQVARKETSVQLLTGVIHLP